VKAARYHGPRDVRVEEVAEPPAPGPHELRLRVVRAAICGTDASEYKHGPIQIPLARPHYGSGHQGPITLGHEFTGVVEAIGSGVEDFAVGDRVVPGAGMWCGECAWCEAGRFNLCARYYTLGLHADGGLADFVNAPTLMCRRVPDGCSDDAAAIAQPFAVALHGLRRARVEAGQTVVLVGVGGIGFFLLAGALARGVGRLIVVDIDDERLASARAFGAHETIDATAVDAAEAILDLTGGVGADVVLEASGAAPGPELSRRAVRRGGTILMLGIQAEPRALDLADLTIREVDIVSTNAHVCTVDLPESIELLADERIVRAAIDRVVPLEAFVEEGLVPLAEGKVAGKVLVAPGG